MIAIAEQISNYIGNLPTPKQTDILTLHHWMLQLFPSEKIWFLDGKNNEGKIIANPNIGYGTYNNTYANGTTKPFYKVGISSNSSGISVYIMGLADKQYLINHFKNTIGKANITSYCIKFKKIEDVDLDILKVAMRFGMENGNGM